jgi:PAS domain S-box-containing protein
VSSDRSEQRLPAYLVGTLLLRGRTRLIWTTGLVLSLVVVGAPLQHLVGHETNAVVAAVSMLLGWMWGPIAGAAVGLTSTLANAAWAQETGLSAAAWGTTGTDALAVAAVSAFAGHVARVLERALGDEDRANRAYDELEAVARDRMLSITDQVPIGLFRTTTDGRIIGGNDALMNILGFPDHQSMLATNVWDHYIDTQDRSSVLQHISNVEPAWNEFQLRKADGTVMWVRDWAVAVLDDDGNPLYFDGVLEDITARHLADERFRAAFEDSPYGMTISTADGYLVRGNQAVAELFGQPLEEMTNLHFSEFTYEEDMDITSVALERAAAGKVVRYEKRLRRRDGSFFWALISLAPIRDVADPQLFVSHVMDVTERRRVREGLENLVRSKDELIASVSHELRTPLTVVHGLAQELDTSWISFSIPEQKEFIRMIAQQSAEVAHIVEDLLVAARADIGKLPIHPASVDLRGEIDAALSSVPDMKVDVSSVGEVAPVAFADPSRVRQIVRNLFSNAHRYGGPEVHARLGCDRQRVWIEISDNGGGVRAEEVAKIFEPYERAHNAEGQPMSVGLGLTVSRKLAEMMGGALEYRYRDSWAVFRLELPAAGTVHTGRSA